MLDRLADHITQTLDGISREALEAMEKISIRATEQSRRPSAGAGEAMAAGNLFNTPQAGRSLFHSQENVRLGYAALKHEPFIARVKVLMDNGEEKTYYFGRNFTVGGTGVTMVGYLSGAPLAGLPALDIGDIFTLPNGDEAEVIEKGFYNPRFLSGKWDGIDNIISHHRFAKLEVASLRARRDAAFDDDPFAVFGDQPVWSAPQRRKLQGTGLRDQSVMNKIQDEIFRLPIDSKIMLEGPPGTGKTSTLIKRVAHNLALARESGNDHSNNWIMFSPTELLEHYLREAFSRDNVPAGQNRIQTWAVFRNDLAKRVLGLLRSGTGKSGFLLEQTKQFLSPDALADQPRLYAAFDQFQRELYRRDLEAALVVLSEHGDENLKKMARWISNDLDADAGPLSIHRAVDKQADALRRRVETARKSLNIDGIVDAIARRRRDDLPKLQLMIAGMNEDEEEDDVPEPEAQPVSAREKVRRALKAAIRAMAMAKWNKRDVAQGSPHKPVVAWLGDCVSEDDLLEMGRIHTLITAAGKVTSIARNYFAKLPERYRAFRRKNSSWFLSQTMEDSKLTCDELDLLVAVYLDTAQELMSLPALDALRVELRNQVVVDEVTDFTPLQLRAMANLVKPESRSFFACGDFNQRLTVYGAANHAALTWAVPGIEFRKLTKAYRQSEELRAFANRLIRQAAGQADEMSVEGERGVEGYAPVAFIGADHRGQSRWIAARIEDIGKIHADLPSIAVFVPDEEQVNSVTDELRVALKETNIDVIACPHGQVLGREHHVRVFAIEHIKGLEFEAAFFHSVHKLAENQRGIFERFLYVGATRAATFLGLTAVMPVSDAVQKVMDGLPECWDISSDMKRDVFAD